MMNQLIRSKMSQIAKFVTQKAVEPYPLCFMHDIMPTPTVITHIVILNGIGMSSLATDRHVHVASSG